MDSNEEDDVDEKHPMEQNGVKIIDQKPTKSNGDIIMRDQMEFADDYNEPKENGVHVGER